LQVFNQPNLEKIFNKPHTISTHPDLAEDKTKNEGITGAKWTLFSPHVRANAINFLPQQSYHLEESFSNSPHFYSSLIFSPLSEYME
jgi:hypothetical protein